LQRYDTVTHTRCAALLARLARAYDAK